MYLLYVLMLYYGSSAASCSNTVRSIYRPTPHDTSSVLRQTPYVEPSLTVTAVTVTSVCPPHGLTTATLVAPGGTPPDPFTSVTLLTARYSSTACSSRITGMTRQFNTVVTVA